MLKSDWKEMVKTEKLPWTKKNYQKLKCSQKASIKSTFWKTDFEF